MEGKKQAVRVLITGGAGFIGINLTSVLSKEFTLCLVDDLSAGSQNVPYISSKNISLNAISILEEDNLDNIFKVYSPEIVIHLAAVHFIPFCVQNPKLTFEVNTFGMQKIVELSNRYNVQHLIFASSAAVYGPHDTPCSETTYIQPICNYGLSKYLAEEVINKHSQVPSTIFRLFNVYGPKGSTKHIIVTILEQLQKSKVIQLGTLETLRDYIYISDVVAAIKQTIMNKSAFGKVFNLGTGIATSGLQLIDSIKETVNMNFDVSNDPNRVRNVDMPYLCADNSFARKTLNWEPKVNLKEGLKLLYDSYS